MLSFVQSTFSLEQICSHLSHFVRGRTADGYWYALRWGCPNRVPDLLHALGDKHSAALLDGMAAWHLIHRSGNIQSLEGSMGLAKPLDHSDQTEYGVTLEDTAVEALMRAAEADLILTEQMSAMPHEIRGRSALALHQMTQDVLQAMDKRHIDAHPRRVQLVLEALLCDSAEAALQLIEASAP